MFSRSTHGAIHQVLQREGLYGVTENWQFDAGGDAQADLLDATCA